MPISKRARLLPDLLTARKARPFDAPSVTEAETAALSKARLRTKLVADLVQSRSGTLRHEPPAGGNDEAAQINPDVLYRKGDAAATGFRPASWSYDRPSMDGDDTVADPLNTSHTRDQEPPSGQRASLATHSNVPDSVSPVENGVEKASPRAAEASIEADLRVATVAGSETAAQSGGPGAIIDPLREELSPQAARAVHEPDRTVSAGLLEPASNTVSPPAVSEESTDPPEDETTPSSTAFHREPNDTAVASVLQSDSRQTLQISAAESITTAAEVDPAQTCTVAPVPGQAAIVRLAEPTSRDSGPQSQSAQLVESGALVTPPVPASLAHEAANSSHATVEIAPPERTMLEGRIDLTPNAAEFGSPSAQSTKILAPTSEDRADIADTSGDAAQPLGDPTAEERVSGKGKAYAELGSMIENLLTERQYGVARVSRDDRISRGSLAAISSDSLMDELQAARGPEAAPPERGKSLPFLGAGVAAAVAALIGCAAWEGLFTMLVERLTELLS